MKWSFLANRLGWGVVTLMGAAAAWPLGPDQLVPANFSLTNDVGFGNSIYVQGDVAELGSNSVTAAPKLIYNSGAVWRNTVGLPPSTTFQYRYIRRTDSAGTVGDVNNGTALTSYQTTTTAAKPGLVLPATKVLHYYSAWTAPVLQWESAPAVFTNVAMTNVGPGRSPGERRWRAAGFGVPGQFVKFRISDGAGGLDLAPGGVPYQTPLDLALLQDGGVYNYEPAATVSASRIEVINNVASPQGLLTRSLRVYLPRGYDSNPSRRYPVLYMHDGNNIYGSTGSGFPPDRWNVDGTLNSLIAAGQCREVIVVGIDNTTNRNSEYIPPSIGTTGDKYHQFVRDTVKPLIDATYRTKPDFANTGVAGSSLGGLISTYMGLESPTVFSRIGVFSPAYWAHTATLNRLTTETPLPNWRVYLDSGTTGDASSDGFANCVTARDSLVNRGQVLNISVLHVIGVGDSHNEAAWRSRFPTAARFLYPIEDEASTVADINGAVSCAGDWALFE